MVSSSDDEIFVRKKAVKSQGIVDELFGSSEEKEIVEDSYSSDDFLEKDDDTGFVDGGILTEVFGTGDEYLARQDEERRTLTQEDRTKDEMRPRTEKIDEDEFMRFVSQKYRVKTNDLGFVRKMLKGATPSYLVLHTECALPINFVLEVEEDLHKFSQQTKAVISTPSPKKLLENLSKGEFIHTDQPGRINVLEFSNSIYYPAIFTYEISEIISSYVTIHDSNEPYIESLRHLKNIYEEKREHKFELFNKFVAKMLNWINECNFVVEGQKNCVLISITFNRNLFVVNTVVNYESSCREMNSAMFFSYLKDAKFDYIVYCIRDRGGLGYINKIKKTKRCGKFLLLEKKFIERNQNIEQFTLDAGLFLFYPEKFFIDLLERKKRSIAAEGMTNDEYFKIQDDAIKFLLALKGVDIYNNPFRDLFVQFVYDDFDKVINNDYNNLGQLRDALLDNGSFEPEYVDSLLSVFRMKESTEVLDSFLVHYCNYDLLKVALSASSVDIECLANPDICIPALKGIIDSADLPDNTKKVLSQVMATLTLIEVRNSDQAAVFDELCPDLTDQIVDATLIFVTSKFAMYDYNGYHIKVYDQMDLEYCKLQIIGCEKSNLCYLGSLHKEKVEQKRRTLYCSPDNCVVIVDYGDFAVLSLGFDKERGMVVKMEKTRDGFMLDRLYSSCDEILSLYAKKIMRVVYFIKNNPWYKGKERGIEFSEKPGFVNIRKGNVPNVVSLSEFMDDNYKRIFQHLDM